jgi:hypothetical protein
MKALVPDAVQTLADREREAIAYAVPAHMLTLAFFECREKGWELRMDVIDKLDKSCGVPLAGFDVLSISRLAKQIDELGTGLLHDLSPDDPVDALHTVAMFVLTLVDQGLLRDVTAIVVVVSLLLMEDIKVGNSDWPFKERFLRQQAKKLLHKANLRGLYTRRMVDNVTFETA